MLATPVLCLHESVVRDIALAVCREIESRVPRDLRTSERGRSSWRPSRGQTQRQTKYVSQSRLLVRSHRNVRLVQRLSSVHTSHIVARTRVETLVFAGSGVGAIWSVRR